MPKTRKGAPRNGRARQKSEPKELSAQFGLQFIIATIVVVALIGIIAIIIVSNAVNQPAPKTSSSTTRPTYTSTSIAPAAPYYTCSVCQPYQTGYACPPSCPYEVGYPNAPCTSGANPVGCFQSANPGNYIPPATTSTTTTTTSTVFPSGCCTGCLHASCGYTCCPGYEETGDIRCSGRQAGYCVSTISSTSTTSTTSIQVTQGPVAPTTIPYFAAAIQTSASPGALQLPQSSGGGGGGQQGPVQPAYTQFLCAGSEGYGAINSGYPAISRLSWSPSAWTHYSSVGIQAASTCSLSGASDLSVAGIALSNPPSYTTSGSQWNPAWWLDIPVIVTQPNSFVVVVGSCGLGKCNGFNYYSVNPYKWNNWLPPTCTRAANADGSDGSESAFVIVCTSLSQSYYIRVWGANWPSLLGGGMTGTAYVYHS